MKNQQLLNSNGRYPVVTNSNSNNGITGFSNLAPTEKGNIITFSDTTTTDSIFFQPKDFIGYSHIQGLYPIKFEKQWNKYNLLFIVSIFKKSAGNNFNYGNKFNRNIAKNLIIKLPIKNNTIDFDFMESFIAELETQRIVELETYLKTTGLSSYELTQEEEDALNKLQNSKLNFDSFRIASSYMIRKKVITVDDRGLFDIRPTKKKINANSVVFDGSFNYVARGESQNGIRGKIDFDTQYLNDENTISFGQDTATMFYQKEKYFTGDKIQIFSLNKKYGILNNKIALFLISSMNKTFSLYSWGSNSFSLETISNENVYLPITSTQKVDFEYMETLISAIQKLVIKDVVEYTGKKIKTTKEVVSSKNR